MSKEPLAQMEVEEALVWPELERSTRHFGSMPDIEFISTLYCPMFQCMTMDNHSNFSTSAVERHWRSAGTFAPVVRQIIFDSRHHAIQSLLAT
jgi:hypothetical protein